MMTSALLRNGPDHLRPVEVGLRDWMEGHATVARAGADLAHLDLRGPHDLRHTFATWLEDAGIPSRVIDELMGHAAGRRDRAGGSPMGRIYRETTLAMLVRVIAAMDERLTVALRIAAHHAVQKLGRT